MAPVTRSSQKRQTAQGENYSQVRGTTSSANPFADAFGRRAPRPSGSTLASDGEKIKASRKTGARSEGEGIGNFATREEPGINKRNDMQSTDQGFDIESQSAIVASPQHTLSAQSQTGLTFNEQVTDLRELLRDDSRSTINTSLPDTAPVSPVNLSGPQKALLQGELDAGALGQKPVSRSDLDAPNQSFSQLQHSPADGFPITDSMQQILIDHADWGQDTVMLDQEQENEQHTADAVHNPLVSNADNHFDLTSEGLTQANFDSTGSLSTNDSFRPWDINNHPAYKLGEPSRINPSGLVAQTQTTDQPAPDTHLQLDALPSLRAADYMSASQLQRLNMNPTVVDSLSTDEFEAQIHYEPRIVYVPRVPVQASQASVVPETLFSQTQGPRNGQHDVGNEEESALPAVPRGRKRGSESLQSSSPIKSANKQRERKR